jgi:LysR family transcriptional regulator, carnitine catabolism transcriptional activator
MDAELRHIRAFLAVARRSSFSRAAGVLGVSQPALTVQIQQFERALGVRLLDRNTRQVALTPVGRDLVEPLERLLLDLDAVVAQVRDVTGPRRGAVPVAALPSIAAGLLPRAIRALVDRHEGVTVRVRDVTAGRIVELVKAGEVDFGIGSLLRADPELDFDTLFTDRLCAFAPADHALARRRRVTLRELCRHPLILTSRDSSVRRLVDQAIELASLSAHVVLEATYMTTAIAMVDAGLGTAVLPASAVETTRSAASRAVAITNPVLRRDIGFVTQKGRSRSPAAELLVQRIRALATRRQR